MSKKLEGISVETIAYLCRYGRMSLGNVLGLTASAAIALADEVSLLVAKENGDKRVTGPATAIDPRVADAVTTICNATRYAAWNLDAGDSPKEVLDGLLAVLVATLEGAGIDLVSGELFGSAGLDIDDVTKGTMLINLAPPGSPRLRLRAVLDALIARDREWGDAESVAAAVKVANLRDLAHNPDDPEGAAAIFLLALIESDPS